MRTEYTEDTKPRAGRRRWLTRAAVTTAILEVAAAAGLLFIFGTPGGAIADDLEFVQAPVEQIMIEIPLLDERLQNRQSGLTRVYDVEVVIQVAAGDATSLREELSRCGHELRAELVHGWRSADPAHLDEPSLETMSRRYEDLMLDRFGRSSITGGPLVHRAIIISGTGFPVE
ncbi:MAG: hypothetical protein P8J89_03660 [Phycisphaerales bacterium]|nr:hypothetical protein [Phycisphaerales bacterium]